MLTKSTRCAAVLAATLAFALAGEARAAVAVSFEAGIGRLTINLDAGSNVTVNQSAGNVRINGADPGFGVLAANTVQELVVTSDATGSIIDLAGMSLSAWSALDSVTVTTGGGTDSISGSPFDETFIVSSGSGEIKGADGNDTFQINAQAATTGTFILRGQGGTDEAIVTDGATVASVELTRVEERVAVDTGAGSYELDQVERFSADLGEGDDNFFLRNLTGAFSLQSVTADLGGGSNAAEADECPDAAIGTLTLRAQGDTTNVIVGSPGADVIELGDATDFVSTGGGADTVDTGGGDDEITLTRTGAALATIDGGDGNDLLQVPPGGLGSTTELQSSPSPGFARVTTTSDTSSAGADIAAVERLEARGASGQTSRLDVTPVTSADLPTTVTLAGGGGSFIDLDTLSVSPIAGDTAPYECHLSYSASAESPRIELRRAGAPAVPAVLIGSDIELLNLATGQGDDTVSADPGTPSGDAQLLIDTNGGDDLVDLTGLRVGSGAKIFGRDGADTIIGSEGEDDIEAGGGNDVVRANSGTVDAGTDDDEIHWEASLAGGRFRGSGGRDTLYITDGSQTDREDFFISTAIERGGVDPREIIISYFFLDASADPELDSIEVLDITGRGGTDLVTTSGTWDIAVSLQSLAVRLGDGNDICGLQGIRDGGVLDLVSISGEDGDDLLRAAVVPTIIDAGPGSDEIIGGPGDDDIACGPGIDHVELRSPFGDDTVAGDAEDTVVVGDSAANDTLELRAGAAAGEAIFARRNAARGGSESTVSITGGVAELKVEATTGGADAFRVLPLPAGAGLAQVSFTGAAANDSLRVIGTSGTDEWQVTGTTIALPHGRTLTASSTQSITLEGLGGDDDVVASSAPSTPITVELGEGTADRLDFLAEGLPVTIAATLGQRVYSQPGRATVTVTGAEIYPEDAWTIY